MHVTQSAHQAVEEDSTKWSFAVPMHTTHGVSHWLFAEFLVDSRFAFRYHSVVVKVAAIKIYMELRGGAQ